MELAKVGKKDRANRDREGEARLDFDEVTKSAPQLPLVLSIRHGSNLSGPRECRKENPYSVSRDPRSENTHYLLQL